MSFDLLSEPIRKYVRDKRWEQLRPIQIAAISRIITTNDNYILASRTASGKTEAAFLPILSKVDFRETGIQVLYISPLIALINDQFYRIEELCKYLDVPVTKWHGEANKTLKNKIIKQPSGIILITPESIEAMFVNKPFNIKQLFSNLKYVVIDEINSFLGADRGIQLKSILFRLQSITKNPFSIVGLSATIGDYNEAKKFTGNELNTKVLLDKTPKEIKAIFRYFPMGNEELTLELLKSLYLATKDNKVLIFPNSRGRSEEVAVKLKKISNRLNGHTNYFSHHSSVDREVREYVEYFAKNNERQNFCIACTSTLELGIDIGTIDAVVQIDATNSISSLIQRVGRSGRQDGEVSNLFLYATNQWTLLQSLACWILFQEGFIEPPDSNDEAYDILLHQALSIVKSSSGIQVTDLILQLKKNFAFSQIEVEEIKEVVDHLVKIDFLEKIQSEVIIGIEGEKIVNNREFYSVFQSQEMFKVINAGSTIGEIPLSAQIREEENILLAARIWKIVHIDLESKKIEVISAKDGKKPMFYGSGAVIHPKIRETMLAILLDKREYDVLDKTCNKEIESMRKDFSLFPIQNQQTERPLFTSQGYLHLYTFTGTRINRTIHFLFNIAGIKNAFDDTCSRFDIEVSRQELLDKWDSLLLPTTTIMKHIAILLKTNPTLLDFSKWGIHLPENQKLTLLKQKYFDFESTKHFLTTMKLVDNREQ